MTSSNKKSWTLGHQGLLLLAIVVVIQLALTLGFLSLLHQAEVDYQREAVARKIKTLSSLFIERILNTGSEVDKFFRTGDVAGLARYRSALLSANSTEADLKAIANDQQTSALLTRIDRDKAEVISLLKACERESRSAPAALGEVIRFRYGEKIMKVLRRTEPDLKALAGSQDQLISQIPELQAQSRESFRNLIFCGLLFNLLLAGCLTGLFTARISSRLGDVVKTIGQIKGGKVTNPPVGGNDEIDFLDQSLREMHMALEEANLRERAVVDNAVDLILSINFDTTIVRANASCAETTGVSVGELVGSSILQMIAPEDRSQFMQTISTVVKAEQLTAEVECRLHLITGNSKFYTWSIYGESGYGQLYVIGRDIQNRKEAEERLKRSESALKALVDSISAGLLVVSTSGKILYANPTALQLMQGESENILGREITQFFELPNKFSSQEFIKLLVDKCLERSSVFQMIGCEERKVPIELVVSRYDFERQNSFLLTFIDLSAKEKLQKLKRDFIAMVSHDLRSPLSAVNAFLELLASGSAMPMDDLKVRASKATNSTKSLIRLVNDLLDAEKLESGTIVLTKSPIAVWEIVEEVFDALGPNAEQKNITLNNDCTNDLAFADPERVRQILMNFVSNSIKFSPSGGSVKVYLIKRSTDIEVSVEDQGPGVSLDDQVSIFEKFSQGSDTKKHAGGSGLGLAICKAIIEQHGGKIGVESDGKRGSRFWFTLSRPPLDQQSGA